MSLSRQINVVVLAESEGRALEPLTAQRTKSAIPFGSKYRIIDFALANCLHSELRQVFVFTQYKSHSLVKHLRDGWSIYNPELGEYITIVAPQMHAGNAGYSGSTDALYQNLFILRRNGAEHILILPGDTIHRMDYAALLAQHIDDQRDVTLACKEWSPADGDILPVAMLDADQRLEAVTYHPGDNTGATVALGILAVRMAVLEQALEQLHSRPGTDHDVMHDLLPLLVTGHEVNIYTFGGRAGRVSQDRYWRSVQTLDSYYSANMDLLQSEPPLDLYQGDWSIRTYQSQSPPARTVPGRSCNEGIFINSVVGGGSVIAGGGVNNSILFSRVRVEDAATVEHAILFEGVQVGERARLRNCIVDKHVHIPAGESIGYDPERDVARFTRSDNGIVVVPKGYRFE